MSNTSTNLILIINFTNKEINSSFSLNRSNIFLQKCIRRHYRAQQGTSQTKNEYYCELLPREEVCWLGSFKQRLLQGHRLCYNNSSNHSQHATTQHQHYRLIKEQQNNSHSCHSQSAQYSNLFLLLVYVCLHVGAESKKTQQHSYADNYIKQYVQL